MKSIYRIFYLILLLGITLKGNNQVYKYFQDSPLTEYYDYSWMELTSPSELERKGPNLRKFPVEAITIPVQGLNSLRLNWKSVAQGDWLAIAAGIDWTPHDLSDTDTLSVYLYSVEGILKENLPKVFLEDVNNEKRPNSALVIFPMIYYRESGYVLRYLCRSSLMREILLIFR